MSTPYNPASQGSDPQTGDCGVGGAFFSTGLGSSSDQYSPSTVQEEINQQIQELLHTVNIDGQDHKILSEYALFYIMYLMQGYGSQVVGQDAQLQSHMNKYFSKIQDLWNILNSADTPSASGLSGETHSFTTKLNHIIHDLQKDKFFTDNPSRSGMEESMIDTLTGMKNLIEHPPNITPGQHVFPGGPVYGSNTLYNLWLQYDPSLGAPGTSGQGDTGSMSQLMRQLGEINQQFTGESSAV